jgi:hypothetical protein
LLIDFLCHGTGTQKIFDICIHAEEKKNGGTISDFSFRAKSRKAGHSFKYRIRKDEKYKTITGYAFEFPYYYSYLQYNIFNEYCYSCKYAVSSRVGDITLGDYWGIEKYASELNAKEGVSMILCNTDVGKSLFLQIVNSGKVASVALPIQCAINENGCLKNPSKEKAERKLFFQHLQEWDFDKVVQVYLTPKKKWIFDLYYGMPKALRNVVRKLMDKRMKYE